MSNPTVFHGNANDLARSIESDLDVSRQSLEETESELRGLLDAAQAENRDSLSAIEDRRAEFLYRDIRQMRAAVRRQESRLTQAREVEDEERQQEKRLNTITPTNAGGEFRASPRTTSISVGRNERTYHPGVDADRGLSNSPGGAFLLDVGAAFMGDYSAQERLMRHMQEERAERPAVFQGIQERASSGTVNFSGLVVPVYAVQDAAPAVTAARPMADVMESRTLPPTGMSVSQSRITTPTTAAIQSAENATVASQAIDDTLLTMNVETAAGSVQLSRQAVERGLLTEDITVTDLLTRVAVALEQQMLTEAATGLATTTFTASQPYVNATLDTTAIPTFLKQLPAAQNTLDTALLTRSRPGYIVMSPRRYNWLTAAVSASWPVLSGASTPVMAQGLQLTDSYGPSVRAVLNNGMKIVVDANVTTVALGTALTGGTQDHVYVISPTESYLYEPPERAVFIRAEQPAANQLGILYVAWEYAAWTFSRYQNQSVLINGTGLGTPSFA